MRLAADHSASVAVYDGMTLIGQTTSVPYSGDSVTRVGFAAVQYADSGSMESQYRIDRVLHS